jgi:cell division protease FtsH
MSDRIGFIYYGDDTARQSAWFDLPGGHEYSPDTAQKIDEEVHRLLDEAYRDTRTLLEGNRDKLETIAQALLKYETLDASEIHALIRGDQIERPSLTDLLDADHDGRKSPPKSQPTRSEPPPQPGLGPIPQPG